jgi:NADP-dependent 3-hydroxy acid dehydrogenase YdfG
MNKVIVITGASSGIGAAAARKLAKLGAKVVLAARRTDKLEALVAELGPNVIAVPTDVSKKADLTNLVEKTIARFGRIDVLWNNAGAMPGGFFDEASTEDWDRMIDINIKGVLYGIHAALPHMEKQGSGHIVATSSILGMKTVPGNGVYAATKFAVKAIMETLREEQAGKIAVTTIYPGLAATEWGNEAPSPKIQAMMGDFSNLPVMDADAVADAFIYAISQQGNAVPNDISLRPLGQTI